MESGEDSVSQEQGEIVQQKCSQTNVDCNEQHRQSQSLLTGKIPAEDTCKEQEANNIYMIELNEKECYEETSNHLLLKKSIKDNDNPEVVETDDKKVTKLPAIDGGWGWAIVFGCFLMHVLIGGWNRGYGVIYVTLRERFDTSAAVAAWVGGAATAARMGLSPFGTTLSNMFGPRIVVFVGGLLLGGGAILSAFAPNVYFLFFSYSLVSGFGGALCYAPCLVMVSQYFDKRRAIALGIATSGAGFGTFLFPFIVKHLLITSGYQATMLIGGALLFHCCLSGALNRPLLDSQPPSIRHAYLSHCKGQDKAAATSTLRRYLDVSLVRDPAFVLFALSLGLATTSYMTLQILIVDYAKQHHSLGKSSWLLSIIGLTDMASRISSGICDVPVIRRVSHHLYNLCLALIGVCGLLVPVVIHSYPALAVVVVTFGVAMGTVTSQRPAMATDVVGVERISSSLGLTIFAQGVGVMAGPFIAGYLRDVTGDYVWSYVLVGSCALLAAAIFLINNLFVRKLGGKKQDGNVEKDVKC